MLLPLLLLALLASSLLPPSTAQTAGWAHGGGACETDWDCSLGGVCSSPSNTCACDPAFTGPTCALLNLQRGSVSGTCGPNFDSYYSWGGRTLKDPATGDFHLYASFLCRHSNLGQWTTVSSAAHFVSPNATGPFEWAETDCDGDICTPIEIPWSHNEVVVANQPAGASDPAYLLFHIGDGVAPASDWFPCYNKSDIHSRSTAEGRPPRPMSPEEETALARARSGSAAGRVSGTDNPGSTAYVLTADALDGPWTRAFNNTGVFINFTGSWTTYLAGNPAPLIFPNGSAILFFTATPCPPNSGALAPNCIAAAYADSWDGPYSMRGASHPITYPESEDPFVFRDVRGNFHLLTNVNTCHARFPAGVAGGGHAWSRDGVVFSNLTLGAFGPLFTLADGTEMQNSYVERPLVHMSDADGVTPLSFHVGVGRSSYLDSCNWAWLFCTDPATQSCGPTVPLPPPPPRRATLQNGNLCLTYNASAFPCSGTGPAAGCPVVMGPCTGSGAGGAVWRVPADGVPGPIISDADPSLSLNVDCDRADPHTLVKVLASGAVSFTVNATAGTVAYTGGMCLNTGEGPAVPPCGPAGEVWLETQIQLAACTDGTALGWTVVPA
jgi:hypothetical protein